MIAIPPKPGNADHYTPTMPDSNCLANVGMCYIEAPDSSMQPMQPEDKEPVPRFTPPAPSAWPPPWPVPIESQGRRRPAVVQRRPWMRAEARKVEARIHKELSR